MYNLLYRISAKSVVIDELPVMTCLGPVEGVIDGNYVSIGIIIIPNGNYILTF